MEKIKFKKINKEKILHIINDGKFVLNTGMIGVVLATSILIPMGISDAKRVENIDKKLSSIEYTINDKKIVLEDLYCVEINGNKYICTREKIDRTGLEIMDSHKIFTTIGVYLPATAHDIYSYIDIKTNEVIGTDYTDNLDAFSIYKDIKFNIRNYKTELNEVDENYVNNYISNELEKSK